MPLRIPLQDYEIREALKATLGQRSAAAKKLGISPATLRRRLDENPSLLPSELTAEQAFTRSILAPNHFPSFDPLTSPLFAAPRLPTKEEMREFGEQARLAIQRSESSKA